MTCAERKVPGGHSHTQRCNQHTQDTALCVLAAPPSVAMASGTLCTAQVLTSLTESRPSAMQSERVERVDSSDEEEEAPRLKW